MIIALSGYAGSGKNAVADFLTSKHGFKQLSFANAIKKALWTLNPIIAYGWVDDSSLLETNHQTSYPIHLQRIVPNYTDDALWRSAKDSYTEVRRLLQVLGTEVGRDMFGEDFWVDQVLKDLDSYNQNYVITDTRFPNEYWKLVENAAVIIRINREGYAPVNNHPSETALDSFMFDHEIDNNGTLDELFKKVEDAIPWL